MLKASAIQEIWPAPSQAPRPCYGNYYTHPATERAPASYYDNYGQCDPSMASTTTVTQTVEVIPWGTIILIVGGSIAAYYLYKNRKRIFA